MLNKKLFSIKKKYATAFHNFTDEGVQMRWNEHHSHFDTGFNVDFI